MVLAAQGLREGDHDTSRIIDKDELARVKRVARRVTFGSVASALLASGLLAWAA